MIEGWARDGLTDEEIAARMGVAYSTLRTWRDKYSAISAALKKGKEVVDCQVENALLKRALGYKYKETTRELVFNKDTKTSELKITKIVEKEVAPDTTAQIFWLKNRKPEQWRDKRAVDDSSNDKTEQLIRNMQTITDVLQHPAENRNMKDFEGEQTDE